MAHQWVLDTRIKIATLPEIRITGTLVFFAFDCNSMFSLPISNNHLYPCTVVQCRIITDTLSVELWRIWVVGFVKGQTLRYMSLLILLGVVHI